MDIRRQVIENGCQLCGAKFKNVVYDAALQSGPWAFMCQECFIMQRCKLGTGKGQKYDVVTRKKMEG